MFFYHTAALAECMSIVAKESTDVQMCLGLLVERRNRILIGTEPFKPSELLPFSGPSGQSLYLIDIDLASERVSGVFEVLGVDFSLLAVDIWSSGQRVSLPTHMPDAIARAASRAS